MMRLREAARMMNGELHGGDAEISGVSTDTRTLRAGELFFAIKGERFDAVRFLEQAYGRGAAGAVVAREALAASAARGPSIAVDDTRAALGRLATAWRQRFAPRLVGLTGSNGKTTVKEMIAQVLRGACADPRAVLATEGNLNNDIGVPLTLLGLRADHRYAVIEMGMNHAGEIRYLTGLARPDVALVTNAGAAHIGHLGTLEAIAAAKGEIFEGLAPSGIAVINADDAFAGYWRSLNGQRTIIDFGLDRPAQITGTFEGHAAGSDIVLETPKGKAAFALGVPGVHNVRNALAAAAVGVALDVSGETIGHALARFGGCEGRMQRLATANGAALIDDTYNANPDSMLAAIAVLARQPGRRVLVAGDMAELGDDAPAMHARIGGAARDAGIEQVLAIGDLSRELATAFGAKARHFQTMDDLIAAAREALAADTFMLVKGSRSMQMERVIEALAASPCAGHAVRDSRVDPR